MFNSFKLIGKNHAELNTELRFLVASSRVDGIEILRIDLPIGDFEKENTRVNACVIKILRSLKKEKNIEFYVNREGFAVNSTEAVFLLNKFGKYINTDVSDPSIVYVKL